MNIRNIKSLPAESKIFQVNYFEKDNIGIDLAEILLQNKVFATARSKMMSRRFLTVIEFFSFTFYYQ